MSRERSPAARAPDAAPSPATVRVRGRFVPPVGYHSPRLFDRAAQAYREDPGRLCAGLWWPIGREAAADVTPEQLAELVADPCLEVRSEEGVVLSAERPPPGVVATAPETRDDWRARCAVLEGRVRDLERERDAAELRAQTAEGLAAENAARALRAAVEPRDARIRALERDLAALGHVPHPGWFPRPETSDERAAREAAAED